MCAHVHSDTIHMYVHTPVTNMHVSLIPVSILSSFKLEAHVTGIHFVFLFSSVSHWQYRSLFAPRVLLLFHWTIGTGELISLGILKAGLCCKILGAITLIQLNLSFCFAFEIGLLIGQTDPKLPLWLRMTLNRLFASPLQSWDLHFKFNFKFKFYPFKLSTSCLLILYWDMCVYAMWTFYRVPYITVVYVFLKTFSQH